MIKRIVKLFNCFIAMTKKNNLAMEQFSNRRGFTLIELLVVIAILGILSAGVLTAINITGNINKANLAKAKTFSASVENALSINQVGKWSFEDSISDSQVDDSSGYTNNGTVRGAPRQVANDALGGNALDLNGSGDLIVVEGWTVDLSVSSFTISLWVNLDRFGDPATNCGDKRAMFVRQGGNNPGTIELGTRGAGSDDFKFAVRTQSLSWIERSIGRATLNKWHHVVLTYDRASGQGSAYLNGTQTYGKEGWGTLASAQSPLIIGGTTPNCSASYTDGRIDEVAIYSQALTSYQIHQLYAQGFPRHQLAKK